MQPGFNPFGNQGQGGNMGGNMGGNFGNQGQGENFGNQGQGGNFGNMGNMGNMLQNQTVRKHSIRNHDSWESLIKETTNWVNSNTHVKRVINISVVLCHATNEGMTTIYYNDAQDQQTLAMVNAYQQFGLFSHVMDTYNTWSSQQDSAIEKAVQINGSGTEIIGFSDLEVNKEHNRALTVIWYMGKY